MRDTKVARTGFLVGAVVVLVAVIGGAWWMLRPRAFAPPGGKAAASPSVPAVAKGVRLPDGTKVTLTLLEDLSSASAQSGARIALEVAQDVEVAGVVVIPKGADASGTVADVEKLQLRMSYVKASDGESVRLRSVAEAAARGTPSDVVDLGAVAGKIKDIVVPSGTLLVAYVDEEKVFTVGG